MAIELAREGFRAAPSHEERVYEAARLFGLGRNPANKSAQAVLFEAFTTDDFPTLLASAFTNQAVQAQQTAEREFEDLLVDVASMDFEPRQLVDMWSGDEFEEVGQGEEYPMGTLDTMSNIWHRARKHGKQYGLTWELRLRNEFNQLANFPRFLGNGSIKGQNTAVAKLLVDDEGAWNTNVFTSVSNLPLTPENLQTAIDELGTRTNHRDELIDTSNLVLLHGPALRSVVNNILLTDELEMSAPGSEDGTTTVTRIDNPYRNIVTPLESRSLGKRLNNARGWALMQRNTSDLPSIVRTYIPGQEQVDIRVKRDQGMYVTGGDVPVEQGSFNDDTIWFRGRDVWGIDAGFTEGVWASTGGSGK